MVESETSQTHCIAAKCLNSSRAELSGEEVSEVQRRWKKISREKAQPASSATVQTVHWPLYTTVHIFHTFLKAVTTLQRPQFPLQSIPSSRSAVATYPTKCQLVAAEAEQTLQVKINRLLHES